MNDDYSNTDKMKVVTVDTVQMAASIGEVLAGSAFISGVGWGNVDGIIIGPAINIGSDCLKEW